MTAEEYDNIKVGDVLTNKPEVKSDNSTGVDGYDYLVIDKNDSRIVLEVIDSIFSGANGIRHTCDKCDVLGSLLRPKVFIAPGSIGSVQIELIHGYPVVDDESIDFFEIKPGDIVANKLNGKFHSHTIVKVNNHGITYFDDVEFKSVPKKDCLYVFREDPARYIKIRTARTAKTQIDKSDLSIGDKILIWNYKTDESEYAQVTGIFEEFVEFICKAGTGSRPLSDCEPIPVTDSILNLNGWKQDADSVFTNSIQLYVEELNSSVTVAMPISYRFVKSERRGYKMGGNHFVTVNEFQRLLRASGLKKIASNLKVE